MDILNAIRERHSVRSYLDREIESEKIEELKREIELCNRESGLNIQLVVGEKDAFSGFIAKYSRFRNVKNYIAMVGEKSEKLNETVGYYGEKLVLRAQMLGLNTCWVGFKFITKHGKCAINSNEKLICLIALGYGETNGKQSKSKTLDKVSKFDGDAPDWFIKGVELALLAPTSLNQQKFLFTLFEGNKVNASATGGFMSDVDLGIVKYHFEIGAGKENFEWR